MVYNSRVRRWVVGVLAVAVTVLVSGCVVAAYERPPSAMVVPQCSIYDACPNTYYWDHTRNVYVYYDGYRYIDALGTANTIALPPPGMTIGAPPPGYVPPSVYRAPVGAYVAPPNYRAPPPEFYIRNPQARPNYRRVAPVAPPAYRGPPVVVREERGVTPVAPPVYRGPPPGVHEERGIVAPVAPPVQRY